MRTIIAIPNQSLPDIAIQELGSIEAVFDIAVANNISVTQNLLPGQEITIPESIYARQDVANYFKGKNQKVVTALTEYQQSIITPAGGIGAMIIENSFIVY